MFSSLYQKIVSSATILGILFSCLPLTSVSAQSYSGSACCEAPCEERCPSFWNSKCGCLLGGAALGAAAGAATGAAVSSNGKRGHTGPQGPQGIQGVQGIQGIQGIQGPPGTFPVDAGETLTFNYDLTVATGIVGTTVTPFVSHPNGTVQLGTSQAVVVGVNPLSSIIVTNPEFGNYVSGIQVTSGVVALGATLVNTAVATRDASTTVIANAIPALALISSQAQTGIDFVYGAPPVP